MNDAFKVFVKQKNWFKKRLQKCPSVLYVHTFFCHISIITYHRKQIVEHINTIYSSLRGTRWRVRLPHRLSFFSVCESWPFSLVPLQTPGENYDPVLTELSLPIRTTKQSVFLFLFSELLVVSPSSSLPSNPLHVSHPPSQLHPFPTINSRGKWT